MTVLDFPQHKGNNYNPHESQVCPRKDVGTDNGLPKMH
jgi:hypothetical protein